IDLSRQYGRGAYAMPDAIYDALWNGSRNVSDSAYQRKAWPLNHRLHQFSGNDTQTYGGATIDVDEDYIDISLAVPGGTMEGSQAAESSAVFYEGADHHLWRQARARHGRWQPAVDMGGDLTGQPSVVAVGSNVLDVFYRGRGGSLWLVRRVGDRWPRPQRIVLMGALGSAPRAVAQPNGVIDVFWKGSADNHLWHGQYTPGRGWSGPQSLGGHLDGEPAPVENRYGVVQVFWEGEGPGRTLWRVTRRLGQGWARPASLGMGPMGGAPRATALPSGAIDVVWRGSTSPHHVWSAFLGPGHPARAPRDLGGVISGAPWPAAAQNTARVFFRGSRGRLWELGYRSGGRWHPAARVSTRRLGSVPFAAAGMGGGPFEVFWKGVHGSLWAASSSGARWQVPQSLGGHLR
ncbi:MAG: glycoside hydrolase domain-containing protein, partial [Streptosporangiaceae bacterium]